MDGVTKGKFCKRSGVRDFSRITIAFSRFLYTSDQVSNSNAEVHLIDVVLQLNSAGHYEQPLRFPLISELPWSGQVHTRFVTPHA